jgi:ligand-binding sensor domain-containing protein
LPSSQVYDIFQDINGDIWFATDRGLAKYNGFEFKLFDISNGLPSNTIFDFYPQKDGNVWCSTISNNWFYFINGNENFQKHQWGDTLQKYAYNFQSDGLLIKENGNICVSFENIFGYIEIDKNGKLLSEVKLGYPGKSSTTCVEIQSGKEFFHYYLSIPESKNKLEFSDKNSMLASYERAGYKKAANINGYFVFTSDRTLYIKKEGEMPKEFDLNNSIIGIGKYDSKHLWVGFRGDGIRIYDMNMVEKAHYLSSNYVTDLFRDNHGGIWISTLYNGVYYAMNDKIQLINTNSDLFVYQIAQDDQQEITIVDNSGYLYDLKTDQLIQKSFKKPPNLKVYYDARQKSFKHILLNLKPNVPLAYVSGFAVIDVSENPQRPLLIGSAQMIIAQNKEGDFDAFKVIQKLNCVEYAKNGFYYGTNAGLYYLDTINDKEVKLPQANFQYRITDIKLIEDYHFIGTSGNGVLRFNEHTGKIDHITIREGLTSNIINEIYAESRDTAWVATHNGLNQLIFNDEKSIVHTLTQKNGLPNDEVSDILKMDEVLYAGTSTGLLKMKVADFGYSRKNLDMKLFWEKFTNNGGKIRNEDLNDLPHDAKNIKFNFHLSYFGGLNNIAIRYKLIGLDNQWNKATSNAVSFNYLKPGHYTLIVQARAEKGRWEENQLSISFSIRSPYYASWWFISLIVLSGASLTYFFFRVRILIYNKDLVRELLRLILRKIKPKTNSFVIWSKGVELRINSNDVLFFKAEGNYLEIMTLQKKYVIRHKIGEVDDLVPDKLEYKRVHRSYIVRLDKISGKGLEELDVQGHSVPIGKTYKEDLKKFEI